MLFRRRKPPDTGERVRIFLWPRRSWGRSWRYVLFRVWRLKATPHAISLGFATGVFASFTPFMGGHFIIAGILAWMMRGSILASALGTFVGNPLTFPFIWLGAYELGNWVLGGIGEAREIDLSTKMLHGSVDNLLPLIKPMTVGGVPLGIMAGSIGYYLIRRATDAYHAKKMKRRSRGAEAAQA